jgi:MFS family permease
MSARATSVRWRIVGLLLGYAALVHFNRISIAVAGTERLIPEFHISPVRMGALMSAYLWTYTLMMTPGGWFIDRFGSRASLLVVGFGSALCVGLTGVAGFTIHSAALIIPVLFAIRGTLGITNAPFHPGAAHAVSRWIPGPQRAGMNGLVNAAALTGISCTYYLFGFMMDRLGWPLAFVAAAAVTGAVACAWWAIAASGPDAHPGVNKEERRLIAEEAPGAPTSQRRSSLPPWKKRSVILLTLSYAAVGYFQYMFFYWMEYYFEEKLGLGKDRARLFSTIPSVAMALGMAAGGRVTDLAQRRWGARRGRIGVTAAGMVASAALLVAGIWFKEPVWIVTCFSLALASLGACEGAFWTTATDLGAERAGVAAAIVNTGGNAGGALAPLLTPLIGEHFGWQGGMAVAAGLCFLGAILWRWIDPDEGFQTPPAGETSPPAETLRDGLPTSAVS